jgi:cholesterol oxidase
VSEHFDAVVVGSGFGGSVSAYRLAEAGFSVCLLERGKPFPPGSFPRTPDDVSRNLWDPSQGLHGMFDLWTFSGVEALVSSALGGGSIIYANVLLRKDERWFVNEVGEDWPVTRADLEPHYDAAEAMLKPQRYPFETEPYSRTPKTIAMQEAGRELGVEWRLPNLAVTFGNPDRPPIPGEPIDEGRNLHGRQRFTCRLCGECNVGCNYGSKNTLDFNYLTAFSAYDHAEIRSRSEVRSFAPRPEGGYSVRYVVHAEEAEGRPTETSKLPERTITADRLVLSAGALGTPYLLLRNLDAFPRLSRTALGTRFSGNGDLLAFLTKARRRERGRVVGTELEPSIGPVITSALRWPDAADGGRGRGFYVEDGGYPHFVSWMVEVADAPGRIGRAARYAWRRLHNRLVERPVSNVTGELAQVLGGGAVSSGALPLLGMGRDVPDGVLRLKGRYLQVDWTTATSKAYFEGVREGMRGMARALGAKFEDNPLWYFHRVITVHPLGGCPMGRSEETGVVDSYGQVFGHPGLSIADGSVMPGPVGPNPSLTIAALADRFADRIVEEATAAKRATRAA